MIKSVKILVTPEQPIERILDFLRASGNPSPLNPGTSANWVLVDSEGDVTLRSSVKTLSMYHFPEFTLPPPLGHPHAELMAQYAEDAKTTDKPWELWEVTDKGEDWWHRCPEHPRWSEMRDYHRKPITILLNDVEIPIFPNHPFKEGNSCYYVTLFNSRGYEVGAWNNLCSQREDLKNNLIYPFTLKGKESCIKHSKALVQLSKGGQHEDDD